MPTCLLYTVTLSYAGWARVIHSKERFDNCYNEIFYKPEDIMDNQPTPSDLQRLSK